MELIQQLGLHDNTLPIQFVLFLVAFFFLSNFLFKPYLASHSKREEATTGSEDHAEQLVLETQKLHSHFEVKAREINQKIKTIFDQARQGARTEHAARISDAKQEAERLLEQSRRDLTLNVQQATSEVKKELPALSQSVASKILGKELSQ